MHIGVSIFSWGHCSESAASLPLAHITLDTCEVPCGTTSPLPDFELWCLDKQVLSLFTFML